MIFRLRRSRRREEELRAQIDLLQARITELEAEARAAGRNGGSPKVSPANGNGARPQRKAAPRRRTSTAPAASKARKQTAAQAKRARSSRETARRRPAKATARRNGRSARNGNGKLDLNAATFDQLRGLGLSITQTSRLISHRETAGGFGQLDELAEIKGLSRATIAELRSRVRV